MSGAATEGGPGRREAPGRGAPLVSVRGLSKTYRVYPRPVDRLLEALLRRRRHRSFHALRDVSFDLAAGEGLGIIGENGAGKSTLLKILAGVTAPSSGEVAVAGRTASILELGSAFHPELTGRENITLNAAMLGLDREQIREKTPEIIDFSELGKFIDQPIKCYSTGMVMRLGFSIATRVDPDVLIVDEALSVGDGYFQKKCMDRLQEFVGSGGTILFCSHALYYVSAFCDRALWLQGGEVRGLGDVGEVVHAYEHFLLEKAQRSDERSPAAENRSAAVGPARLTDVDLRPDGGSALRTGDRLEISVSWETSDPALEFHVGVGIDRVDGVQVLSLASHRSDRPPWTGRDHHAARLVIDAVPMLKGAFTVYVFLLDREGLHVFDQRILDRAFAIEADEFVFGLLDTDHSWVDEDPAADSDREPAAGRGAPAEAGR